MSDLSDLLIGKVFVAIEVARGEHLLKLIVRSKYRTKVFLRALGDCCSESWFAEIVGVTLAHGKTIRAVTSKILPPPKDGRSRQDVDKAYGITINTDGGYLDIVYRNSSNGCYEGYYEVISREAALALKPKWIAVTDDWQA